jgi:hypothetical protein
MSSQVLPWRVVGQLLLYIIKSFVICTFHLIQGLCRTTKSPNTVAVGFYGGNSPFNCREKKYLVAVDILRVINTYVQLCK